MWTPKKLDPFFLLGTWLEKQEEITEITVGYRYLSSELAKLSMSITWSSISIAPDPGIFLFYTCTVNPANFFFFCQALSRFAFHEIPFLVFLLFSSVSQTLKNVWPVDCMLRLLRRRGAAVELLWLRQDFGVEFVHFERVLCKLSEHSVFLCCWWCCLFFSIFFIHYPSLSFFFSAVTSKNLCVWVEVAVVE